MTLTEQIEKWAEDGKSFELGLTIFTRYGRQNNNTRRMLSGASNRTKRHHDRLDYEISLILKRIKSGEIPDNLPADAAILAAAPSAKLRKVGRAGILEKVAKEEASELDISYKKLKALYTTRAKLSNRLKTDSEDPKVLEANQAILVELDPIMAEMKTLEERIKTLKAGVEPPAAENSGLVVIRKAESYTLAQLEALETPALKALRKRVNDDRTKAVNTSKSKRVKKQSTRARAEKVARIKEAELAVIDKIWSLRS